MLILFFHSEGVIHPKYVPEGLTVNTIFYIQVFDRLCKHVVHVRSEMWRDWKFFLYPHTVAIIQQFLPKKGVTQLSHPPYSPDLSPHTPPPTISLSQN